MAAPKRKETVVGPRERCRSFHNFNTEKIMGILRAMAPGEVLTYKELGQKAGFAVRGSSAVYQDARRRLFLEGINIKTLNCFGVKRLDDVGIVEESGVDITKIKRSAVRGSQRLSNVNLGRLNSDQAMKAMTNQGTLGLLEMFTRPESQKVIEEKIMNPNGSVLLLEAPTVDTETILKMFGRG